MNWILTDCFDTVLIRKCDTNTVKRKWAKKISRYLNYSVSAQEIYTIRSNSESIMPEFYKYNDLAKKISEKISWLIYREKRDLSYSSNHLVEVMTKYELVTEIESLEPNAQHIEKLKENKGKVAVVSDMYCGEEFIWELFENFGIKDIFDRVFVSCDYGYRKSDENKSLYEIVMKELNISAADTVMYDDTDICLSVAKQLGIKGIKINPPKQVFEKKISKNVEKSLNQIINNNYSNVCSLSNYFATFYLFIERLNKECIKKGIKTLYFLSREGEFLKVLFDEYTKQHQSDIQSRYLYVSRKAVLSASFEDDPFNPGKYIEKHYSSTSIKGILKKLDFTDEDIKRIEKGINFSIDEVVNQYWKTKEWKTVCALNGFKEIYSKQTKSKRDTFLLYLKQEGLFDEKKIAIVDIGWRGSMQDIISFHLKNECGVDGFYYGLISSAYCNEKNRKYGLIFSCTDYCSCDYEIWSFYHTQMESLLTASHPGTVTYRVSENGSVFPEFQDWGNEEVSYDMLSEVRKLMIYKFIKLDEVLCNTGYEAEDLYKWFITVHVKTILSIGIKKSRLLSRLQFNQIENVNTDKPNSVIMKESYSLKKNFKKIFKNLDTLRNPLRMIRILQTNNLHFCVPVILYFIKKRYLKEICQRYKK